MRVNINGFPQAEQGGRRLSTSLYFGGLGGSTIRFIRRFPAGKGELAKGIVRPIKASVSMVVILLTVSRRTLQRAKTVKPSSRPLDRSLTGQNLHGSDRFGANHRQMAPVRDTRECEKCHAEMQPVGKLPAMGGKPQVKVFCCLGCKRIESETP